MNAASVVMVLMLSILSVAFPGMLVYCLLWLLIPRAEYD